MEFVTMRWRANGHYRSSFGPETVNTLWNMIGRNYDGACRLTCITDDPKGISAEVQVLPLWSHFGNMPSPHGMGYPSCYRRLPLFGDELPGIGPTREALGAQFTHMDLDVVITGSLNPLVDIDDDFKIWGDTAKGTPYNGSLWTMKAGSRRKVIDTFDPMLSPKKSLALGYIGSDQGWIGACLGTQEMKYTTRDGVYSFRNHVQRSGYLLPTGARIVIFHGNQDPWTRQSQCMSWVRKHYR
jgi:hypothetical protein